MTTAAAAENSAPRASRARRNVIGSSPNRDEYVRMMQAGWTSAAIEAYASYRYGETIPASTVRTYKARKKIEVTVENPLGKHTADDTVDVMGLRAMLVRLQMGRIKIDVTHEEQMSKLFGSTKGEIALMNALLNDVKADMQDAGLFGKAGEHLTVKNEGGDDSPVPAGGVRSLADLIGVQVDRAGESSLARVLHLASKTGDAVETA